MADCSQKFMARYKNQGGNLCRKIVQKGKVYNLQKRKWLSALLIVVQAERQLFLYETIYIKKKDVMF